jgi:hypothetical protein
VVLDDTTVPVDGDSARPPSTVDHHEGRRELCRMQESWRTRARVPIRPRDDDRRFHQASGAWKTENGDGHAKWWLSEPVELVSIASMRSDCRHFIASTSVSIGSSGCLVVTRLCSPTSRTSTRHRVLVGSEGAGALRREATPHPPGGRYQHRILSARTGLPSAQNQVLRLWKFDSVKWSVRQIPEAQVLERGWVLGTEFATGWSRRREPQAAGRGPFGGIRRIACVSLTKAVRNV